MKSLLTRQRRINPVYLSFMVVSFMTGVAGALQAPTLSLFLTREVQVSPFWVGLFFTINAIAGIVISLLMAKRSDNRGDRRNLILFCCLMATLNALLFAFNRHYLTLVTLGVFLSALASVSIPQVFALAREYADQSAREVVMFSSVMRAQLSLAWVIGPPLSFALALNYGFTTLFCVAAGIFLLSMLLIWRTLPSVPRVVASPEEVLTQLSPWKDSQVRLLFIASVTMWACNTMYIIDMPLYISSTLGLPEKRGIIDGHRRRAGDSDYAAGRTLRAAVGQTQTDAAGAGGGNCVLSRTGDVPVAYCAYGAAAVQCGIYRHHRRNWHAVVPGFDARTGRRGNHLIHDVDFHRHDYRGYYSGHHERALWS